MSRQPRQESPSGFYHVMQRGVGKQIIFEEDFDYKVFLSYLSKLKDKYDVNIIAYCLMDNHVHLLLQSANSNVVSQFIQRISSSYARYYNNRYEHSGHVFQNRYKCKIIDSDQYLFACVRYIHNNPSSAGISSRESYRWSSYIEYVLGKGICERKVLLSMIGGINNFATFSSEKDKEEYDFLSYSSKAAAYELGLKIVCEYFGMDCKDAVLVKSLCKSERDMILRKMKNAGLTNRQIEHITGVSKSIVQRA